MIKLDLQDAMDTVVKHLLAGGKRCVDTGDNCQYSSFGNACFVGLNIEDREIAAAWDQENLSAIDLIHNNEITLQFAGDTKDMKAAILQDFQDLHDTPHHWANHGKGEFTAWTQLVVFCKDHNLEVSKEALNKL